MTFCRHFGICGGCTLQDLSEPDYRARKRGLIVDALKRNGLEIPVAEVESVPPYSRRRASFKAMKTNDSVVIGFHAASSHTIVDMLECHVLTPVMTALVRGLRDMMQATLRNGEKAELVVTESETGFDLLVKWARKSTPVLIADLARWSDKLEIARIVSDGEMLVARAAPIVHLAGAEVRIPPSAFLQPTALGESSLQSHVTAALAGAKNVADLFAGCGTFSFAPAKRARVHAVELDAPMLSALADAARRTKGLKEITTEKRNLFQRPMSPEDLHPFDAVVLDPPRAGASAQVRSLANAHVPRVVYVSCDPRTFARDAATLIGAGYKTDGVTPVDQFLWSEHIELIAAFEA